MHDGGDAPDLRPILTPGGFVARLAAEVARVRRKGGFLSLLLIDLKAADRTPASPLLLRGIAERLRTRVRIHDVLALREKSVALLMPETNAIEAGRAAERLLRIGNGAEGPWRESGGAATVFGEVEGGGDALMAAAEDALREAGSGKIVRSRALDGRPRLLVVDADVGFAQALAATISDRGWEAHPCGESEEARQRVAEGGYHGMFLDLMLPGSGGINVLRRAMEARPPLPSVLMSGPGAPHPAILEALEFGPVMFVRKPLSSIDLDSALQMLRELLPGAPARSRGRAAPS
jgi:CheY-like chemotaxis protein